MGFRQPFTLHTDAKNPGLIGVGEYCHDGSTDRAQRAPAGTCEWNLVDKAANQGWPFCVGDQSPANTAWRWNYANQTATGAQYDCSRTQIPSDINYAPEGQTPQSADVPGPGHDPEAVPATIWKKYPNAGNMGLPNAADFGDLTDRRHAADGRADLPLQRGDRGLRRLPGLLRRLVADQQPRRQRRLVEGSPDPQRQQPDAARPGLAAVQQRRQRHDAAEQPRDRHAVR